MYDGREAIVLWNTIYRFKWGVIKFISLHNTEVTIILRTATGDTARVGITIWYYNVAGKGLKKFGRDEMRWLSLVMSNVPETKIIARPIITPKQVSSHEL